MDLKVKISTIKNTVLCWITLWMILLSKTVYFGVINKSSFQWLFYGSGIVCALLYGVERKRLQHSFTVVFPFILLFLLNALYYLGDMTAASKNELLGVALNFLVMSIICAYLKKEWFAKYYIDIMTAFCLISLPCFAIANVSEELARSFCQSGYDWQTRFGYSFFYTWGWNGTILTRNSGPFWEAGAFQGFILLAVLMLLYGVDNDIIKEQRRKWIFLLFVITIITTGSTTGYILLIAVLFTQWTRVKLLFSELPSKLKHVFVLVMAVIIIFFIIKSGNIGDKFSGESTNSALVRYSDLINGFRMWTKNPIIGLGLTSTRQNMKSLLGVDVDDSVGLSFMTYTYGIPFLLYYLYRIRKGIKTVFGGNKWQTIIIFIIFIALHLTEGLWWLPIYLYILLAHSDSVEGSEQCD